MRILNPKKPNDRNYVPQTNSGTGALLRDIFLINLFQPRRNVLYNKIKQLVEQNNVRTQQLSAGVFIKEYGFQHHKLTGKFMPLHPTLIDDGNHLLDAWLHYEDDYNYIRQVVSPAFLVIKGTNFARLPLETIPKLIWEIILRETFFHALSTNDLKEQIRSHQFAATPDWDPALHKQWELAMDKIHFTDSFRLVAS